MDKIKVVALFMLSALIALLITIFGLFFYYENKLTDMYKISYSGASMQVLSGKAEKKDGIIEVSQVERGTSNLINLSNLLIDTDVYQYLQIQFSKKDKKQHLKLVVRNDLSNHPVEKNIFFDKPEIRQYNIRKEHLAPIGSKILDIGVFSSNTLKSPYAISKINFGIKKISLVNFIHLLAKSFRVNKVWEHISMNSHIHANPKPLSPKLTIILFSTITLIVFFFFYFIFLKKRISLQNSWWILIILSWLLIDTQFTFEKIKISNNSYKTFYHLSDAEKNKIIDYDLYRIAEQIKNKIPSSEVKAKIKIRYPSLKNGIKVKKEELNYIRGKLKYFLYPHEVYALNKRVPHKVWKKGRFYYADLMPKKLEYDEKNHRLKYTKKHSIKASRLINQSSFKFYKILGN